MRRAHTVEQVRAAEAALLARLPEGALMQRAAAGLAYAVLDLLGAAYGRRVLLLVGLGDNGGDALYAGALLARRGVAGRGVAAVRPRARGRAGRAARRPAAAVVAGEPPRRGRSTSWSTASSASAAGPGCAPRRGAALARGSTGVPVVAVDIPSGVDVDTGELAGPHVTADADGHLRHPQGRAPRRPGGRAPAASCTWSTSGSTCPSRRVEALQPDDVAALLPRPGRRRPQVHPRRGRRPRRLRARTPAPALLSVAGAASGLAGMVRYVGDAGGRGPGARGPPRGRRRGPGAGLGGRLRRRRATPATQLAAALGRRRPGGRRRRRARATSTGPLAVPAVLTPHAGELAAMLGVERADVEAAAARTTPGARPTRYGAVGAAQGPAHADRRTRTAGSGSPRPAPPWLATAGAGDVLGGLVGALLAAGLDAVRRRVGRLLAARRGRDPAPRAAARSSRATWRAPSRRPSGACRDR